ncbi:hypothetical protein [Chryseobacterium foetidum]|uniref:hypothetical protein n=1 Tax=Chryseobacterium foetidum TaxID=2951057 RepID=UPI0021CA9313|nr:hypothetical protein [Chryseobacterium foetidum]
MTNISIRKIVQKQINSIREIDKYTCTLLKNLSNYKQHGTGVFVKIESKYFLFSAAHVLDDFNDLFIPLKEGNILFKPGGEIIRNSPKGLREFDELDLGILILDEISVKELQNEYTFLECDDIELNHPPINLLTYIIFGYPTSWSKKSMSKNSFHSTPFFNFTKCATKNEYKKHNRNEYLNLIVEYDRKNTPNLKSESLSYGPDLFGISGCGLWYVDPFNLDNNPKLIGIMNEWSKSNRNMLIATRIDAYTEILRKKNIINFKETALFGFK